jgi:hypothetical protein
VQREDILAIVSAVPGLYLIRASTDEHGQVLRDVGAVERDPIIAWAWVASTLKNAESGAACESGPLMLPITLKDFDVVTDRPWSAFLTPDGRVYNIDAEWASIDLWLTDLTKMQSPA